MDEFIRLLLDGVQQLGSVAALADALRTEPAPIYAWIAGNNLPRGEPLRRLSHRLREVLQAS